MDIEQGNVITTEEVHRLHPGMTEADVKRVMGEPVFVDIFSEDRLTYLYTFKQGHGTQRETRVICLFQHGRLQRISTT
jgi:outer membrane protein assembly factor BamE